MDRKLYPVHIIESLHTCTYFLYRRLSTIAHIFNPLNVAENKKKPNKQKKKLVYVCQKLNNHKKEEIKLRLRKICNSRKPDTWYLAMYIL